MDYIDQRCTLFAQDLRCPPEIVQKAYIDSGADTLLDRFDKTYQNKDITYLTDALKHLRKASSALEKVSDKETVTQMLADGIILNDLIIIEERLSCAVEARKEFNTFSPGIAGKNDRAHAVANMVLRVFIALGWKITFGKEPISAAPNTAFCKSVKSGLKIFDVQAEIQFDNRGQPIFKLADWHAPALSEFRKYQEEQLS